MSQTKLNWPNLLIALIIVNFSSINGYPYANPIEKVANVNAKDWKNETLHGAAENGHTNTLKFLIEKGANVDAKNENKETPLHKAAWNGQTDAVKILLESGANVNAEDWLNKTPLHKAASNGQLDIIKILIEKGANTKAGDYYKQTPLHWAAWNEKVETVFPQIIAETAEQH
ncbi:26S proteasome non-ATPase regulatory subunit 10-like [Contarinia nasturtii]|uniref:26S proteasome non-ATPase regulatory subunit 10-like n=1 Tax=Contarinia nasturtii TaxID=265458 RepID=UPI0012D4BA26|nr:26S proteasome non-ATPase regulatory subunit 10-like [Contarinia nasturtii]